MSTIRTAEYRTIRLTNVRSGIVTEVPYTLARSKRRRSYSIVIAEDGTMTFHVPWNMREADINRCLQEKSTWILSHIRLQQKRLEENPEASMSLEELRRAQIRGTRILRPILATAIARYEPLLPAWHRRISRIAIRAQKTRWGSCSSSGTLSFNWRLVNAPQRVLEYVVVHELCHLCYMNHSADFWNLVGSIMPDYSVQRAWLRDHGHTL